MPEKIFAYVLIPILVLGCICLLGLSNATHQQEVIDWAQTHHIESPSVDVTAFTGAGPFYYMGKTNTPVYHLTGIQEGKPVSYWFRNYWGWYSYKETNGTYLALTDTPR